jgi:hypothetical protein
MKGRSVVSKRNTRLADVMAQRHIHFGELAQVTGRNIKTVQRWVYEGRVPRPREAQKAASFLGVDAAWLWPTVTTLVNRDLVNVYTHIGEVPPSLWHRSAQAAQQIIEIAVNAEPVLPHDLTDIIAGKAEAGVEIRVCIGHSISTPIDIAGLSPRRNAHPDMISIYRFDGVMLVWLNRGGPGLDRFGPVLHLKRIEDNGVFDGYAYVLSELWDKAIPEPKS